MSIHRVAEVGSECVLLTLGPYEGPNDPDLWGWQSLPHGLVLELAKSSSGNVSANVDQMCKYEC